MDYKKAIYDLLDYFASCNRTRVALFAVSIESPADKLKTDAFLSYKGERGEQFNQKDIFVEDGVHFNQAGYDLYADFYREKLKEELAKY